MGFDEATLQPTYILKLGVPGKSAGLDIATRLEMPTDVLVHARAVLPRMQADFQKLLSELHKQLEDNKRKAAELEETQSEMKRRQADLEQDALRRERERQREWTQLSEKLVANFEDRARDTIDRLSETVGQRKAAEQAQRLIAKTRREFQQEAASVTVPPAAVAQAVPRLVVEEGAKVKLKDVRGVATVRRILKNGLIEVEAGFLKMQIPREDIVEVVATGSEPRLPKNVRLDAGPNWDVSYRELNIIGQRAEEAIEQLDKFLDSATLASVDRVRIVHGHGMGILKRAVSEFLAGNPHVARFYPASPSEGGTGATVVELRE
jgi:DNA mismatch repair protein MutS2